MPNSPEMHIEFSKMHIILKIKTHILNLIKDSKYEMVWNHRTNCGMGYRTLLRYHSFVDRIQKLQEECTGGLASAKIFNSGAVC